MITGADACTPKSRTTARVLRIIADKNKIVVEGINRVYRHMKPSRQNQQGGRLSKEMPIALLLVMIGASFTSVTVTEIN